jgi:ABC-2 type transport system ATP-binding protein
MLHDPEILIMDEPTDGLDPNQKHQVRKLIREMSADRAIIISTHILEEVEAVCSRAVIIAHGRLLADGTPEELLSRAPDHNAVMITVDTNKSDAVKKILKGLDAVKNTRSEKTANGATRLVIRPKKGKLIADDVSQLLRSKNIPVQEMFVERGSLDDVFRKITKDGKSAGGGTNA